MEDRIIKRICRLVFILAAVLICVSSRPAAAVIAAEDVILEEAGADDPENLLVQQDILIEEEGVWSSEDAEIISDMVTGVDTISEESDPDEDVAEEASDMGLILGIEEVDDPGYVTAETEKGAEEAAVFAEETETVLLEATGDASCASYSRMRTFALETYESCYGEQLSNESLAIYQKMADIWAAGKTDNLACTLTSPFSFDTEGTIEYDEVKKANTAKWDKENCEEYQDILLEMKYAVQSAFDAFAYDYPEVFWLGRVTYSYSIGFSKISDTQLRGRISSITICGVGAVTSSDGAVTLREKYEGAPDEIGAFQSAVDAAAAQIRDSLPEGADTYDTVKAIHDYICNTVSYGENEYAHTAAGVFHKEPRVVVCEGYAKAMKILCRQFDISSALIVGSALKSTGASEDHMWNYVKMDDGNWYMADATWDDQASGIRYVYFLAGSGSQGFNAVISQERQVYTCFSGAVYTKSFTLPALSENAYHHHTFGDWVIVKEAACTEAGSREQYCTGCGAVRTEEIAAPGHSWDVGNVQAEATCTDGEVRLFTCQRSGCGETDIRIGEPLGHDYVDAVWTIDKAATCTASGSKSHHCSRCGSKTDVTAIAATGHRWNSGKVTKAAACTAAGVRTYTCTVCGGTKTTSIAALGHNYSTAWIIDKNATCTAKGSKSHHCSRCGSKTDVTAIAAAGHTWDAGKVTKAAACTAAGVRTYTCTACGEKKTAKIASLGHKYGSWVTTKAATVLETGVQTSTCSRCGGKKTKSVAKLPKTIKLNVSALPLKVKQSTTSVQVTKMSPGDYVKSWKSSNTKIAVVSKKGKITGKKAGAATITVTLASGARASVKVTVQKASVKTSKLTVTAKNAVLKKNQTTLKKGAKLSLTAAVSPLTSTDQVVFVSSNKKVATVSGKGVVLAKGAGTARITVKSGCKKVMITVKVPKTAASNTGR